TPWLAALIMLTVVVIALAAVAIWLHMRTYEGTDDAYVDVVSEQVSPQVAGRVVRMLVTDNQDVKAGQVLAEIDPQAFQARADEAAAAQAQATATLAEGVAAVAAAKAQAAQSRASLEAANAQKDNAEADLRRYRDLSHMRAGAVSLQQLDRAEAAARTADAQAEAAEKAVGAADAQVESAQSRIKAGEAQVRSAEAQVSEARLNLGYTQVRARLEGRVANRIVTEGSYIQPGTPIMAIVPAGVYVTANFKETQLAHMRAGQSAEVAIDAFPDLHIPAHVDSIEPASGQAFSQLPAENATGNWVKIVQRVPVKIVFDRAVLESAERPGPGMSVEVKVEVR
ncbi:MAG TPA: HlyD family secretion protein, partial [Opitutaceae bacterium]